MNQATAHRAILYIRKVAGRLPRLSARQRAAAERKIERLSREVFGGVA